MKQNAMYWIQPPATECSDTLFSHVPNSYIPGGVNSPGAQLFTVLDGTPDIYATR